MITIFKNIINIIELDREEPLTVLEEADKAGKVTDTVSAVLAGILQAEETRGHTMLKHQEARLLDLDQFKEKVKKCKFVVVIEDWSGGRRSRSASDQWSHTHRSHRHGCCGR